MSGTLVPIPKQLPKVKFPKGPIGPQFTAKLLPWFEQYWHENKKYPSSVDIIQKFALTVEQVELLNQSKFWLLCLDRRGIARPDVHHLNEKQIAAIAILTNFGDLRNPVARLSQIGVSEEELNGWRSNPEFKRELQNRASEVLDNVAPDATVELAKAIKRGNFQAIKFYFEITGQAQSPEAINVKMAMQILVEAVQKHVKDPAVLDAIGAEVQAMRAVKGL